MLVMDFKKIGSKLFTVRKRTGFTQSEVAELAGLSDRTYADIERGSVNMRIETILRICKVLQITPDDILTENNISLQIEEAEVIEKLQKCTPVQKKTALQLLSVYLDSILNTE